MSGTYDPNAPKSSDAPYGPESSYGVDAFYESDPESDSPVSSEELVDDALYVIQDQGSAFGRNLVEQVRAHPVPALLTGIGVTWMLANSLRASRESVIWHDEVEAGTWGGGENAVRQGYDFLRNDQPLVLGALAIAAGALIGSLLPESETEASYLGEYSDRTRSRVREEVEQASILVKEAAVRATEGVRQAADAADDPARSSRPDAGGGSSRPTDPA